MSCSWCNDLRGSLACLPLIRLAHELVIWALDGVAHILVDTTLQKGRPDMLPVLFAYGVLPFGTARSNNTHEFCTWTAQQVPQSWRLRPPAMAAGLSELLRGSQSHSQWHRSGLAAALWQQLPPYSAWPAGHLQWGSSCWGRSWQGHAIRWACPQWPVACCTGSLLTLCLRSTLCTTTCAAFLVTVLSWAAAAPAVTPSGALLKPLHQFKPACRCILAAGLLGACKPPLGWYACAPYGAPVLASLLQLSTAAVHVKPLQGRCWMR